MRPTLRSLALLLPILSTTLACGSPEPDASETGTGEPTSTGAPNTDGTTGSQTASTSASPTTTEGATTDATTDATTGAAEELPPIDSVEALELWLAGGAYKQWAGESQVHASTGPHGGNVRTYVNAIALDSLAAQQAEHPQNAATVKELYGDSMDTLIGYAVSRKTAAQSEGGATWYWYERINATVYGGDLDVPLCTGCHGGGADYILTPYPLQ